MKGMWPVLAAAMGVAACEGSDVTRVRNAEEIVVRGHKLSLHGVDGSSRDAACAPEQLAADAAEARLTELLMSGQPVAYRKTGAVCLQFMLCDAVVTVGGADLSEMLVEEGLAVRASAPGEPPFDWCRPAPLVDEPPAGPLEAPPDQPSPPPPPAGAAQPNTEETLQSGQPIEPAAPDADAETPPPPESPQP